MTVFCFDRDYTVSTSPSPARMGPTVPLSWVRTLAHETQHTVVATGNQQLCVEADIPGDATLRSRYASLSADERHEVPTPPSDEPPSRRTRLRLVEALFPADRYVVVDDADLGDVEDDRWTHFFPWTFVAAVRDGKLALPLPVAEGETASEEARRG